MEKNERIYHKECRVVEDLLTKRMSERLTDSEISQVEAHLDSCPQCRTFQDILLKMQETVSIEGKSELSPDPAIRENILRHMKAGRQRKRTNPVDLLRFMKQVLEFRIPVYQAVLTVALVIIIAFALQRFSLPAGRTAINPAAQTRLNSTVIDNTPALDNPEIIKQQKIGTNLQEDSVLTRFVMSVM